MSNTERIETNLEMFNDHIRRTSQRLSDRAGSAPPDDRTSTITPVVDTNGSSKNAPTRGRGRGRGKKSTTVNTRASTAARTLAAEAAAAAALNNGTNPVTPEALNATTQDAQQNQTEQTSNAVTRSRDTAQSTIGDNPQPTGLIVRDDVNIGITCKQRCQNVIHLSTPVLPR